MTRGRPRYSDRPVAWKIHIKSSLASRVELLLLDPMRRKVRFGARGALIERLLENWVKKQQLGN